MRKKISPRDCDVRLVTYGSVKDKTDLDAHITVLDQGTQGGAAGIPKHGWVRFGMVKISCHPGGSAENK
jgi:hypothetical protein